MFSATAKHRKPVITIGETEHEKLTRLAEAAGERIAQVADELLAELDRSHVVKDGKLPADVVRMGSTFRYVTDAGDDRTVTLVYPGEADIAAGKISILTPSGVALIGLSPGQSIDWEARDGRRHRLTVQSVEPFTRDPALSTAS
ncbi:MAG: nucleoside diphosphate kinase regulator [Rhizobiales bacterium]|nr:nucleoside diphosphate kinase regulator [Hyphomicrobiales bacterium]